MAGFLDVEAISGLISSVLHVIRMNSKILDSCIPEFRSCLRPFFLLTKFN